MFDKNDYGTEIFIEVNKLKVDYTYQRPEKLARAKKRGKEFDPRACGSITLAERPNGDYYILDGQQRWLAAKEAKQTHILARIIKVNSISEEAVLFKKMGDVDKFTASDKYHMDLAADDLICKEIDKWASLHAYSVDVKGSGPRHIRYVAMLRECMEIDPIAIKEAHRLYKQIDPDACFDSLIISGFFYLEKNNCSLTPRQAKSIASKGGIEALKRAIQTRSGLSRRCGTASNSGRPCAIAMNDGVLKNKSLKETLIKLQ